MAKIPMIAIISEMVEQTPEQIAEWTKEDWLAFAKWLRSLPQKPPKRLKMRNNLWS